MNMVGSEKELINFFGDIASDLEKSKINDSMVALHI
jgi:hypothetical protein